MSAYDRSPTGNEPQTSLLEKGNRMSMAGGELVPTPELGKDWDTDEGRRSKAITEKPKTGGGLYKSWFANAKRAMQWKYFIFVVFGFLCWCVISPLRITCRRDLKLIVKVLPAFRYYSLAALLFFVIPRVPSLELFVDVPLASDNRNVTFTRIPALFNWNAQLNVAIDGRSNWIPVSRCYHLTDAREQLLVTSC